MNSRTPEPPASHERPSAGWLANLSRTTPGLTIRQAICVLAIAGLIGLLQILPLWGATPQPGTWASAARGMAASLAQPDYGHADLADRLAMICWKMGGPAGLTLWQGGLVFIVGGFFALSALVLILWLGGFFHRGAKPLFIGAIAVLLLWSGWQIWTGFTRHAALVQSLALTQPIELAEAIAREKPGTVFATPTALNYLILQNPALATLNPERSAILSRKARRWREALRSANWRSAMLAGPNSEFTGLLDHLLTSPDWRLAQVSNQGYLFLREAGEPCPSLDPTAIKLGSDRETALYLAQIAERYEAIRRTAEARAFSKIAVDMAPNDLQVLSHTAALEASRGKWHDAIVYCDRALKVDPTSSYLRLLKASCLLEVNQAAKAEQMAREVLDRSPNDLYTLFLYARISRSLHDPAAESETLEKLIKLTPPENIPANYFVFLGQAYAKLGMADPALGAYRKALDRPDMGPELGAEVRNQIEAIEQKVGK